MGKLHELLAVETDLKGTFKRIVEEGIVTFSKKPDHFIGQHKKLEMFDESKQNENLEEHKELVTTVKDKLDYIQEHVVRYLDVLIQKEKTNQEATDALVVDGKILIADVPATCLLNLETELKTIRSYYEAIPTLAPGVK